MLPHEEQSSPAAEERALTDASVVQASSLVRRMLKAGAARADILASLATIGEELAAPDATVSILVLDGDGLLRNGSSPNLPLEYLSAIDRLKPDPLVGTCAAAAATGCAVVTPDFFADDKWAELRHLPYALGYIGAWSQPIKSLEGTVLGTFGTYFRERRFPTPRERIGVEALAAAAAEALAAT